MRQSVSEKPKVRVGRCPAGLAVAVVMAAACVCAYAGCSVDVPPTPHQKEMWREKRRAAMMKLPDAAAPVSASERWQTVVVAMHRQPRHLNPALRIGTWGYRVAMFNIFEPLVRRDPKTGAIMPCLASHWSISPDGKVYRFTLRESVRWHDGRPLTASDVTYSLTRVVARGVRLGPFRPDIRDAYERVDMVGPREIRVVLRRPHSYFLDHLAEYPVLPRHVFLKSMYPKSRGSQKPVGTGPFRFESWRKGSHIELLHNQNYWGKVPAIRRLRFQLVEDRSKALTLLKRGEVDVLPEVIRQHYPEQLTDRVRHRFLEVRFEAPGFAYIIWNTRNRILADFRVRRALTMLIDRKRIITEVHHGLARMVPGPYWRPAGLGDPKLKPWSYDPIKARNLLDKAGWRDRNGDKIRDKGGVPMRIVFLQPVGASVLKDELRIISGQFSKSGVELVQVPTDWPMMQRRLRRGRFMAAALKWAGRPIEDLSTLFHSTGKRNFGVITNLILDRLLTGMRHASKRTRRAPMSAQVERTLHSYQPVTFLHAPVLVSLVHRRLTNVTAGPDWIDFSSAAVTSMEKMDASRQLLATFKR